MVSLPKVCIVSYAFGRSSEVWLWRQVLGLRRLRPHVLCGVRENGGEYPCPGVEVDCLPDALTPYTRFGYRVRALRGFLDGSVLAARGAELESIRRKIERIEPDVVFCHFGTMGLRVLPAAKKLGIPVVVHFNGLDISQLLQMRSYRRSLVRQLREFAGVVVVAGYQRDWIQDHCGVKGVHLIPYGVPCQEYEPGSGVGVQPCRFLSVGRLVEKKSPLDVLRAFASCHGACPETELTMIGSGPLEPSARGLAESLGIADSVTFLGAQPHARVQEELQRAGVFVQHSVTSSLGDMEGWPVSIGEASASALPVVATRHGDIPRQVIEGESGLLVDEHDWRGMGEAMVRLAMDPPLRERLGRAGREHMKGFDLGGQIEKLEASLLRACGTGPGAARGDSSRGEQQCGL